MASFEGAVRCLKSYGLRWLAERYHFVLKSGCRVGERQLESADRHGRAVATSNLAAWRLRGLTYEARRCPDQSW